MSKTQTVVKSSHITTIDYDSLYGWAPHNVVKRKLGYKPLEIMNCQTRFNNNLQHDCSSDNIDWIWVNNLDEYPDTKYSNYLLTVESTYLGYHIIDCQNTTNSCISSMYQKIV